MKGSSPGAPPWPRRGRAPPPTHAPMAQPRPRPPGRAQNIFLEAIWPPRRSAQFKIQAFLKVLAACVKALRNHTATDNPWPYSNRCKLPSGWSTKTAPSRQHHQMFCRTRHTPYRIHRTLPHTVASRYYQCRRRCQRMQPGTVLTALHTSCWGYYGWIE